jgi:hypothetical protein
MDSTYLIVAGLCLIGLTVRTGYELLKKTGRVDTKNRAIFAVVFVAMCLMLASWPVMCPLDPRRIAFPGVLKGFGLGVATTGIGLAPAGLVQLRGLENIGHLVTTGLYVKRRERGTLQGPSGRDSGRKGDSKPSFGHCTVGKLERTLFSRALPTGSCESCELWEARLVAAAR